MLRKGGMIKRTVQFLLDLCILLSLTSVVYARVFELHRGSRYDGLSGESLGWTPIGTTAVQIGQGRGTLQSWGASGYPEELIHRIHQNYSNRGWPVFSASGQALGWVATLSPQGHLLRYLVLSTGRNQSVLFELGQSRADYEASGAPAPYLFDAAPLFPGGEPLRYLADLEGGTEMQSFDVAAGPEEVASYYAAHFTRSGWASALPPTQNGEARPMEIYVKGGRICLVQAYFSGQSQRCTVLLVQRSSGPHSGAM